MRPRVGQDKGQRAELTQFAGAFLTGAPMPIPVGSLVATTSGDDRGGREPVERQLERV